MQSNLNISQEYVNQLVLSHTFHLNNDIGFEKENIILKGNIEKIFDFYIEDTVNKLKFFSNNLKFVERSWADFEEERIQENTKDTQYSFSSFFKGYSSTLASLQILDFLAPYNIVDYNKWKKKLELIQKNYEITYSNFEEFDINHEKMALYKVSLLSSDKIKHNAIEIVNKFTNLKFINLFDSKYRDYLRIIPYNHSKIGFDIEYETYKESIEDIEHFITHTFSQYNLISSIYSAYFDIFKLYKRYLKKDNQYKTFEQYKNSYINSIKSCYGFNYEKTKLEQKIANIDEQVLFEDYEKDKAFYQKNGSNVHSLINQTSSILQQIFNPNSKNDNNIIILHTTEKFIFGEHNNFKFYAFKDDSVKETSSEAYFGFSIKNNEVEILKEITDFLHNDILSLRKKIETITQENPLVFQATNFYSQISMLEEFNTDFVQNFFFKTDKALPIEIHS